MERQFLPKPIALQAFFDIQKVLDKENIDHAIHLQSWRPSPSGGTAIALRFRCAWPLPAPVSFQLDEIAARLDVVFYPRENVYVEGVEEMSVNVILSLASDIV